MMEPIFHISSLMHLMVDGAKFEMLGKTQPGQKRKKVKNHENVSL